MNDETKNSKLVFSPQIARRLLKMGNQIIDIKADKNDPKKTVFAFLKDAKFESDFNTVINDISDERSHRKAAEKKDEDKEEK